MSLETKDLSNSLLKEKMVDAVLARGYCSDMDTCKTPGVYNVDPQRTVNIPPGAYPYGTLTVSFGGTYGKQEYVTDRTQIGNEYKIYSQVYVRGITATKNLNWVKLVSEPLT